MPGKQPTPKSLRSNNSLSFTRLVLIAGALFFLIFLGFRFLSHPITNSQPTGTNIIAFGDSLTAGTGANAGEDYPIQLSRLCGQPIQNMGIPGNTTAQALARIEADVLQHDPRIVIVLLGGNDLLQRKSETETFENLRTIIKRIQDRGALVILVGVRGFALTDNYGSQFKKVSRELGTVYVPDILSGILTSPKLKADQVHPNGEGYKLIAERIYDAMKPFL